MILREKIAGYVYHRCPECDFDAVLPNTAGRQMCPLCAEDNGRDVTMTRRDATPDDKPEGRDWRKEEPGA